MSRVNERASWLVLAYRVPGETARLRASVWRRLKAAGAVYLANSVAALPAAPSAERLLRRLRSDISRAGGSAQLLWAGPLAGGADLVRLYNAARDDEYAQIIAGCDELLGTIGSSAAAGLARLTSPQATANWPGWLGGRRRPAPGTRSGPGRPSSPQPRWPSAPRPSTASPAHE